MCEGVKSPVPVVSRLVSRVFLGVALAGCSDPGPAVPAAVDVAIVSEDVRWTATVRAGGGDGGGLACGREIHVPVGSDVKISIESRDYLCIFSAPGIGLRTFATPGIPAEYRFRAERPGTFEIRSDEMCGLPATGETSGRLVVETAAEFRRWERETGRGAR